MVASGPVLWVTAGGSRHALPLERVLRIARPGVRLSRAPGAGGSILGVAPMEGEAAPVVDLGRWLGTSSGKMGRLVVVKGGFGRAALSVEAVEGVGQAEEAIDLDRLSPWAAVASAPHSPGPQGALRPDSGESGGDTRLALASLLVSGQRFAVPLDRVVEVLEPGAAAERGLEPAQAADLLGLRPESPRRVLVLKAREGEAAVAVGALGPVLRPSPSKVDPASRGFGSAVSAVLRAAGGELVGVVDVDRLTTGARRAAWRPAQAIDGRRAAEQGEHARCASVMVIRARGVDYAAPLKGVEGVARTPKLKPAPGAHPAVAGAMVHAGEVVPVLALEPACETGWVVQLRSGAAAVGLRVGALPRVGRLSPSSTACGDVLVRPAQLEDGGPVQLIDLGARAELSSLADALMAHGT